MVSYCIRRCSLRLLQEGSGGAWQERAACSGQDPNDWMEVNSVVRDARPRANYAQKRAICGGCPVRPECLEEALADPELIGIWGGTTSAERHQMRRRVANVGRRS